MGCYKSSLIFLIHREIHAIYIDKFCPFKYLSLDNWQYFLEIFFVQQNERVLQESFYKR